MVYVPEPAVGHTGADSPPIIRRQARANRSKASHGLSVSACPRLQLGALAELVQNLALSHPELAEAPITAAHLAWLLARAPAAGAQAEEWFLQCAAVVDRVSRALGALTDLYQSTLQVRAGFVALPCWQPSPPAHSLLTPPCRVCERRGYSGYSP